MIRKKIKSENSVIKFIDYKPADLRIHKEWIIVYYAKNPLTKKLDRFRLIVPKSNSIAQRMKNAKQICKAVNSKLEQGWTPFLQDSGRSFKTLKECTELFLSHLDQELAKGNKRSDTLRSYKSNIKMIELYQAEKKNHLMFAFDLSKEFVVNFLDWVYYERENSARTFNNYLFFIRTFSNYLIARGFINDSPVKGIARKSLAAKKRQIIPKELKTLLGTKLPEYDFGFYVCCMMTYYCLIRRTEATKLRVKNVNLSSDFIFVPANISKNKKDEYVTIPKEYKETLERYIYGAPEDYFLFGKLFQPSKISLEPKKISDTWIKIRTLLDFDPKYQFYSLKDTGITDLLEVGIPAIKVRDQARHYDIKITEGYTPRNKSCDEVVKNASISF